MNTPKDDLNRALGAGHHRIERVTAEEQLKPTPLITILASIVFFLAGGSFAFFMLYIAMLLIGK